MVKNVTVIAQARFNATRLPGKVLMELKGRTVLAHIIARVMKCKQLTGENRLVIATSVQQYDDSIANEARNNGAAVFRGSEEDVLSRFYGAAVKYNAEHILRLCCDNPFVDYGVMDASIDFYRNNEFEYIRNENTPIGIGMEIFSFECLKTAYLNAKEPYQREHVTPYIREHSENMGVYAYAKDYSKYRLTLDTPEDWLLTNEIYDKIYTADHDFKLEDVIKLLREDKRLYEINKHVIQKKAKS